MPTTACKSVAQYANAGHRTLHARMADEAMGWTVTRPADTYLRTSKALAIAQYNEQVARTRLRLLRSTPCPGS